MENSHYFVLKFVDMFLPKYHAGISRRMYAYYFKLLHYLVIIHELNNLSWKGGGGGAGQEENTLCSHRNPIDESTPIYGSFI